MGNKKKRIPEAEWRWFGEPAHLCVGRWCRFHMATQIGRFIVSTVGKYVHPSKSGSSEMSEHVYMAAHPNGEPVGLDRYYETMVFVAGDPCSAEGCDCGMPTLSTGTELEMDGYQTAGEATRGHMAMCARVATGEIELPRAVCENHDFESN